MNSVAIFLSFKNHSNFPCTKTEECQLLLVGNYCFSIQFFDDRKEFCILPIFLLVRLRPRPNSGKVTFSNLETYVLSSGIFSIETDHFMSFWHSLYIVCSQDLKRNGFLAHRPLLRRQKVAYGICYLRLVVLIIKPIN